MSETAFFTICAKNYVSYAHTLFDSLKKHYPGGTFYLVLADRLEGARIDLGEGVKILEAEDLPVDDLARMAFRYDITEFSTAIKPASFKYIFDIGEQESVVYIDPDILVVSPLEEMHQLLEKGAQAVLTPHICEPVDDGDKPDDVSMLRAGVYNLGFLALRRSKAVNSVLDWWHGRLTKDCRIALEEGLFVDQKWIDLLPSFLEDTAILRHPGYNAAYWNLMQRHIEYADGKWFCNKKPLRFFHFSGIDLKNDRVFSKHQSRFDMNNIGDLRKLAKDYRQQILNNGQENFSRLPYAYGKTSSGENIPTILRYIYREHVESHCSRSDDRDDRYRATVDYCNALEDAVVQDAGVPVSRLMYRIWQDRPDLQAAFDLSVTEGRSGFLNWYCHTAGQEYGFGAALVDGVKAAACNSAVTAGDGPNLKQAGQASGAKIARRIVSGSASAAMALAPRLRAVYRHISPQIRLRIRVGLLKLMSVDKYVPRGEEADKTQTPQNGVDESSKAEQHSVSVPAQASKTLRCGALLVGYPKAELGMGEHVRLSAQSFLEKQIPFGVYNFDHSVIAQQRDSRYSSLITDKPEYKANIFHINADQMEVAQKELGEEFFRGRYNIGYWAWELSRFPDIWLPATELVDEIWAPSRFIQHSISEKAKCPVVWMPLAVKALPLNGSVKRDFGVAEDDFVFMFYFDFASFATRKNPEAPIQAFKRAFSNKGDNVRLVIKIMGSYVHGPEINRLKKRVSDDPRIVIIDEVLTHEEMVVLVNRCDCFVSLHRSEGFGRGMAEAMVYGKPVIATNYSGNTDFMSKETAMLVDYSLVPVNKGCYVHWENQVWAEPDIDHATWYMRKVAEDEEYADKVGSAGKRYMELNHSPNIVAEKYRDRLERIGLL